VHPSTARRLWLLLEPLNAVVYFAPEAKPAYEQVGLRGYWMGYFASRSAAMGPVPPEVVIATFYNFHPDMVRRAIPDAWSLATPEAILAARLEVAGAGLRRLLGPAATAPQVAEAAELAMAAARAVDLGGRPLFAAHVGLDAPDDPLLALWHAACCLREHRGDGHVATLLMEGVDGCEAHVLLAAQGIVEPARQQERRGWSEQEWAVATERLVERRLLTAEGELTEVGHSLRAEIEDRTDALAVAPYAALGEERVEQLEAALTVLADASDPSAGIPYPNPIGLPPRAATAP
jgi:hypothetical protein